MELKAISQANIAILSIMIDAKRL